MAVAVSKFNINQTLPKRGQIKINICQMIAKSLTNLANGDVGGERNTAVAPVEHVGGFKSGSKHVIKQKKPRRGQIKIMVFKKIAKSLTGLVTGVDGVKKKTAGNGGCRGGCFTSPATVIPVEIVGELEPSQSFG
ncbi:hypothetical protein L1987_22244 [Smallanthus sonchifolius]|uniref:Uncharacterized protein n=1 Tax=Smallanthus sonchifolius TaxID=185202 RepID=A0ACB9IG31_9ASTR|nr:hypothetical protein L1987_22244 [Smallanthus sonchifolius]